MTLRYPLDLYKNAFAIRVNASNASSTFGKLQKCLEKWFLVKWSISKANKGLVSSVMSNLSPEVSKQNKSLNKIFKSNFCVFWPTNSICFAHVLKFTLLLSALCRNLTLETSLVYPAATVNFRHSFMKKTTSS